MQALLKKFTSMTRVVVSIDPCSGHTGVSSVVEHVHYGELSQAVEAVLRPTTPLSDRVELVTGETFAPSPYHTIGQGNGVLPHNKDAVWLLDRLNAPQDHYAKIRNIIPQLREVVYSIHGADKKRTVHDLQALASVEANPQPFYVAVPRTNRIYASGINYLTRELRTELERQMRWVSFDIRQAQLAIVSEIWKCDRLKEFVSSGKSFWEHILADLRLEDTSSNRGVVKTATYATIFGAGKERLGQVFTDADLSSIASRFLSNTYIAELFQARKQRLASIQEAGRITDAYGNKRELRAANKMQAPVSPTSLLAAEVQSYEMWMLVEPLRAFVEGGSVGLMTYLHDGFVLVDGSSKVIEIRDDLVRKITERAQAKNFYVQVKVE
jgi:hypothetical protein